MDRPYQSSRNQSGGGSGGGAAVPWNAATVQVGAVGVYECQTAVAAATVAGGDVLEVCLADTAITDENEPEDLDLKFIRAKAGPGSVEFTLRFHEKTSGPINLLWRKTT